MNNPKSRRWLALASMVIVALLLAACAPADTGEAETGEAETDGEAITSEEMPEPTAAAEGQGCRQRYDRLRGQVEKM